MVDDDVKKPETAHLHLDDDIPALLARLEVGAGSNLITVLQGIQDHLGYLPPTALKQVNDLTGIPLSRIYGVVTFYAQFHTEPRGRHTVRCCNGTACHVRGAPKVLEELQLVLGVEEGHSTPDMIFYLETVACLGTCFLAPVMMIDDRYFGNLKTRSIKGIIETYGNH